MKRISLLSAGLCLLLIFPLLGQTVPDWEPIRDLQLSTYIMSAISDGYGQHVILTASNAVRHYLLTNDGSIIADHSNQVSIPLVGSEFGAAITSYSDKVMIVAPNESNQLVLYQSTNGGQNWSSSTPYNPGTTFGPIDAFADNLGVHVVWMNADQNKVYYARYRYNEGDFIALKDITEGIEGGGGTIYRPKVVTSQRKAIVAFIRWDVSPIRAATRDFDFDPEINNWDTFYRNVDQNLTLHAREVSLSQRSDTVHILIKTGDANQPRQLWSSERHVDGSWAEAEQRSIGQAPRGEDDFRRASTVVDDTVYATYPELTGFNAEKLNFLYYKKNLGWPTPFFEIDSFTGSIDGFDKITISSWRTGVYVFYYRPTVPTSIRRMRRKVITIFGNIARNGYWTGNNWISDRTDLVGNITVKMKQNTNSITTLLANKSLYVQSGATLMNETGAQFILESGSQVIVETGGTYRASGGSHTFNSGAQIATNGGTIHVPDNVTLTINNGATLASLAAGTISLGNNAKIVIASDGTLLWNANSVWQFGANAQVEIYGTVRVAANVTLSIPANSDFLAHPGAKFEMGQSSQITVEGKLHALGSSGSVVEFKPIVPTRTWNGIYATQLAQSVDLFLDYVRITGVTRGLHLETPMKAQITNSKITNVSSMAIELVPNPSGLSTDVVFINKDSINSSANGIVALNTSKFQVENCRITGSWPGISTEYAGINLTGSSPKVLRTWVRSFYFGLHALESSAPIFEDGLLGGNNVIRDNNIGVKCKNSNAVLGLIDGEGDVGGQNCIHDNTSLDVHLLGASIVMAQFDYWGTGGDPDPNKLLIEPGSFLEYHPPLSVDPNEGGLGPSFAGGGSKEVIGSPMSPGSGLMRRAVGLRSSGRYQEAITLLMSVISDSTVTRSVKQWAVSELLSNAMRLQNARLPEYLRQLELSNPELLHIVRGTLPMAYLNDGNVDEARGEWNANILRFPGSDLECAALYGKFLVALYHDLDLQQAGTLFLLLETRFPSAPQTQLAGSQLEIARSMENSLFGKPSARFTRSETGSSPGMWELEQNYPNPFNPSTVIRFHLPEDAYLSLKVYDMLGREIAILVDEFRKAGYYEAVFDASSLASGVYFYRMTAGNYTAVKKLVVMK